MRSATFLCSVKEEELVDVAAVSHKSGSSDNLYMLDEVT